MTLGARGVLDVIPTADMYRRTDMRMALGAWHWFFLPRARTAREGRRPRHWRTWADDVRGAALPCRHHLPEEAPRETYAALRDFLVTQEA